MARVLIIDHDEEAAAQLRQLLLDEHFLERASDANTALFLLSATAWDVVILDPDVPGADGAALLRNIREMPNPPEVVVVTPQHQLDQVVQTLRAGAFEFVSKPIDDLHLVKAVANAAQLRSLRNDRLELERHQRGEHEHLSALVEERTRQMQQVFSNVPGLLYRMVLGPSGKRRFSFVSIHCEEVLELSRDVLLSEAYRFDALVHPDDAMRFRRARDLAEARQERFRFEGRFVLRSGKTKWLQCVAQPAVRVEGVVVWDGIITDVTERNELQAQLLLADRLASVGSMAAAVAHEVSNPLAYLKANLALLERRLEKSLVEPETRQLLKEALGGVERIEHAVSDLRTFARSEEVARPVELGQVLDASVRLASNEIRHRALLTRRYEADPSVVADESNLGQLFLNLLIAMAQSIPEGEAPGYEISIRVWTRSKGYVCIELADTGPGLADELLERAFDPLESRAQPLRSGLGLYVCHRIVNSMGGQITAGRSKSGGNRFLVTLPVHEQTDVPSTPPESSREVRPARVLVVDDEELVVKALCRALEGHAVVSANSGRSAIELIREQGPFDLVLCDVMMPDMTGADVYDAARQAGIEQRIVFVTGGAFTSQARAFLESVPNPRIEKPFSRERVRALLARGRE